MDNRSNPDNARANARTRYEVTLRALDDLMVTALTSSAMYSPAFIQALLRLIREEQETLRSLINQLEYSYTSKPFSVCAGRGKLGQQPQQVRTNSNGGLAMTGFFRFPEPPGTITAPRDTPPGKVDACKSGKRESSL